MNKYNNGEDYVICPYCNNNISITLSEVYQALSMLKRGNYDVDFDKLLNAVKEGHIATLTAQIVMLTQLQENTSTDYSTVITQIQAQITAIGLL